MEVATVGGTIYLLKSSVSPELPPHVFVLRCPSVNGDDRATFTIRLLQQPYAEIGRSPRKISFAAASDWPRSPLDTIGHSFLIQTGRPQIRCDDDRVVVLPGHLQENVSGTLNPPSTNVRRCRSNSRAPCTAQPPSARREKRCRPLGQHRRSVSAQDPLRFSRPVRASDVQQLFPSAGSQKNESKGLRRQILGDGIRSLTA